MSHYQPEPTPLGIDPVLSEYLHRELMRLADTFQLGEEDVDSVEANIDTIEADIVALQTDKVAKAGDTMTGDLSVVKASPVIEVDGTAGTEAAFRFRNAGLTRWKILANNVAESGGNVGTNLLVQRYNDAGAAIDNPITVTRSTGIVAMPLGATTATPAAADDSTRVATTNFVRTTPPNFGLIPDAGTPVDSDYLVGLNADGVPAYANGAFNFATIKGEARVTILAAANTFSARQVVQLGGTRGVANANGSEHFEIIQTSTGAAMMTFHRGGAYAANFGIDTDNQLSYGGWSAGAVSYKIVHSGNNASYGGSVMGTPLATTSGTTKDFTGIPAGVTEVTINLTGVSGNGSSPLLLQIGDSGGIENTGYLSTGAIVFASTPAASNGTTGFHLNTNAATAVVNGVIYLSLLNSSTNLWAAMANLGWSNSAVITIMGGSKALSGVLDRIRLTFVNGTDAFDAGSMNIKYRV